MGPPDSHGISRAPCYSGTPSGGLSVFVYRAVTFCGRPFHEPSTNRSLCNSLNPPVQVLMGPTTPTRHRHRAVPPHRFRLFPVRSPLLGESRLLSLPRPTEMFQFRRFPPQALCVQTWVTGHDPGRVSPFGHPRIKAFLAARSQGSPEGARTLGAGQCALADASETDRSWRSTPPEGGVLAGRPLDRTTRVASDQPGACRSSTPSSFVSERPDAKGSLERR